MVAVGGGGSNAYGATTVNRECPSGLHDAAQCASLHKQAARTGVLSTAPPLRPQRLHQHQPSSVHHHSNSVLWAASEVAVSNVHPGVLAAGEGECCVTPERKAVWEVCIVVCLSVGTPVPPAARRGRPSV